jgi:hypothetical protein
MNFTNIMMPAMKEKRHPNLLNFSMCQTGQQKQEASDLGNKCNMVAFLIHPFSTQRTCTGVKHQCMDNIRM